MANNDPHRQSGALMTAQRDETAGKTEGKPKPSERSETLLEQVRDREAAHRLNRRLPGHLLPDIELQSLHMVRVPLRRHLAGWVVVEFFPAGDARPASGIDEEATAVLRVREEHAESLRDLAKAHVRTLSVVSDSRANLDLATSFIDPRGLLLYDPQLLIADALKLPTAEKNGAQRYRRLTLITRDSRITKVMFPPDRNFDQHVQRILSWIRS